MEAYKLYDAEYRLMDLVWSLEPVNSTALSRMCLERFGWKKSTSFNLIRKLVERGFLLPSPRRSSGNRCAAMRAPPWWINPSVAPSPLLWPPFFRKSA